MKFIITHAIVAILLIGGFAAPVLAGPFEDGIAAYGKGNYATALLLLRPLADQGMARAQIILGVMYSRGQGVTQNYDAAMKWYRRAADQGDAAAQTALGAMYANGLGVPQDRAKAARLPIRASPMRRTILEVCTTGAMVCRRIMPRR